jgi:hypothetical protein
MRFSWFLVFAAACAWPPEAAAQFGEAWATFARDTSRIRTPGGSEATHVTTDTQEKDFVWGDVDRDGWTDLVVVRKQPHSTPGMFPNYLLMNEGGILVDRSAQFAADSDVAGDFGFLTPTNDRDVALADVDVDGWLDIITATTYGGAQPKHISHPRVYRNKGSVGGVWQGFRFENFRFPELPSAPDFCAVTAGDVSGDGWPDLYFVGYASSDDKLFINDGTGSFIDSGTTRMTAAMLLSDFGSSGKIADMNGDGVDDVVKATALGLTRVSVAYNNPANEGFFNLFHPEAALGTTYHVSTGDLNKDGKLDLIVSDDGTDFYRLNNGNDALGRVAWGPNQPFQIVGGTDDLFAGTNLVVDLNNDGWNDAVIADVDVDAPGCDRRCHIYHNLTAAQPGDSVTLREEAQQSGSGGWKGVVGMLVGDLGGTFDVAVFDLDNDGDNDMVFGRCSGTMVWINQLHSGGSMTPFCFGDGTSTPCPCGNASAIGDKEGCLSSLAIGGKLTANGNASVSNDTLGLTGTRMPNSSALYFQGTTDAGTGLVFGDGLRCAAGAVIRLATKANRAGASEYPEAGNSTISVKGLVAPGDSRTYQVWYRNAAAFCNPQGFNLTNGVRVLWAP